MVRVEIERINGEVELRVRFASGEQALAEAGRYLGIEPTPVPPADTPPPPAAAPTVATSVRPHPEPAAIDAVLVALQDGPLTMRTVEERAGLSSRTTRAVLGALMADGVVEREGTGSSRNPHRFRFRWPTHG